MRPPVVCGACASQHTWDGVLRGAQVDHEVAAQPLQVALQVRDGLQQELRAHGAGLGVLPGRRDELPRVEAIQRHDLRATAKHTLLVLDRFGGGYQQ